MTVYLAGTQTLASLFSDDGITPTTNPVTTDSLGRFFFYTADGKYDLKVSGGLIVSPFTEFNVIVNDPFEINTGDATVAVPALNLPSTGVLAWNADLSLSRDSAGVIDVGTGTLGSTGGTVKAKRFLPNGAGGGLTFNSSWGSTSTVSGVAGNDNSYTATVTANGSGIITNPQIAVVFGTIWPNVPGCIMQQTGGTGAINTLVVISRAANAIVFQWNGLAVAGLTYEFTSMVSGR